MDARSGVGERINKYLAFHLGISRREADNLVSSGKVLINKNPAKIGSRVDNTDAVTVGGQPLKKRQQFTYIMLNKPVGYVCSKKKQGDNPTIFDVLPSQYQNLKPVGRLDKNSSGLLLLTDDGNFSFQMTHPKFYKQKIYKVHLNKPLEPLHHQMINDFGIQLEDGPSKLTLEKLDGSAKNWQVKMTEGRNRQIRRTFEALGYFVAKLHRIQFGHYRLDDLKPKGIKQIFIENNPNN